tara:strand:- start:825 stop:7106 length:6282 start_codon:yes stop_codon:yes gene_type:complete
MGWFSFITKPIKKVVKWVGNAVEDVVDFVVEDILEPVVNIVGDVVQGMLDNPLETIAVIAATVTGNAWAIPFIRGAATAIEGGDAGDVLTQIAISYVAGKAGNVAGKYVGDAVGEAAGGMGFEVATQEVASHIAAEAVNQATTAAVRTIATGGDLKDVGKSAAYGALFGAASAGVSEAGDYLFPTDAVTSSESANTAFGFEVDADAITRFTNVSASIGDELAIVVNGWDQLPDTVQEVIKNGATASIKSLVVHGEIREEEVASAIARAVMTANVTASTLAKIPGIDNKTGAIISKIAGDVVGAAYTDADGYETYQAAIGAYGLSELHKEVDKLELYLELDDLTQGNIGKAIDAISGADKIYKEKLAVLENKRTLVSRAADAFNNKREEFTLAIEKYKSDVKHYNDVIRHGDKATADKFKADNIDSFYRTDGLGGSQGRYSEYEKEVTALQIDYESATGGFQTASTELKSAQDVLFTQEDYLTETTASVREEFTNQVVEAIKPDFDADFVEENYIAPMGLTAADEPITAHQFWLDTGRNILTSEEEFIRKIDDEIIRALPVDTITRMISPAALPPPLEVAPEPPSEVARTELLSVIDNISKPSDITVPPKIDPVSGEPVTDTPGAVPLEPEKPVKSTPAISNFSELREYVKAEVLSDPRNLLSLSFPPTDDVPEQEAINISKLVEEATLEWLNVNAPVPITPLRDATPVPEVEDVPGVEDPTSPIAPSPIAPSPIAPPAVDPTPDLRSVPTVQNRIEKSIEVANDLRDIYRVLSRPDADTDVIKKGVTLDAEEVPITVHEQALNELNAKYGGAVNFERSIRESFPDGVPELHPSSGPIGSVSKLDLWIEGKEEELDDLPPTDFAIGYGEGVDSAAVFNGQTKDGDTVRISYEYDPKTDAIEATWSAEGHTTTSFDSRFNKKITETRKVGAGRWTIVAPDRIIPVGAESGPDVEYVWDERLKNMVPSITIRPSTASEDEETIDEETLYREGWSYNPNDNTYYRWNDAGELQVVAKQTTSETIITDPETGREIPEITIRPLPGEAMFRIMDVPDVPPEITINELRSIDPVLTYFTYVDAVGEEQEDFNIDAAQWDNLTAFSKMLLQSSMNMKSFFDVVDEHEGQIERAYEDVTTYDEEESTEEKILEGVLTPITAPLEFLSKLRSGEESAVETIRKNFASVLYAGGDLSVALDGLVTYLAKDSRRGEITKVGNAAMQIAMATNPPEYRAAINAFMKGYNEAEDWEKAEFLVAAMGEDASRGVVLRHLVTNELLQEIFPLMVGAGAFTVTKWGVKGTLTAKGFAEEAVEALAKKYGLKAAISGAALANFAETAGANGSEARHRIFDAYMSTGEYTEEEANWAASVEGGFIGLKTGFIELLSTKIAPQTKLIKALGDGPVGSLLNQITSAGIAITGEILSEGIEAGVAEDSTLDREVKINPERAEELYGVTEKRDKVWINRVWGAGLLEGTIAGGAGSVSTVIQAGVANARDADASSAPEEINEEQQDIEESWAEKWAETAGMDFPVSDTEIATQLITEAASSYNPTVFKGLQDAQSSDPVISKQGEDAIRNAFGWDNLPTINMEQNEEGVYEAINPDAVAIREVALNTLKEANPFGWNTTSDVRKAYENSKNPNYNYTNLEVLNFTGEVPVTSEAQAGDLLALPAPHDLQGAVDQDIDDKSTTYAEVITAAEDEGFKNISLEDARPFMGQGEAGFDASTKTAVTEWAAPRAVDEDDATRYFEGLGYRASPEDIANFLGQGGPNFEAETEQEIVPYVNRRQTIRPEIEEFFRTQGYTPSPEEVEKFLGQGGPDFEAETERALIDEYDRLAVLPDEVQDIYTALGVDAPITAKDKERLSGQYPEAELEGRATEYLPVATSNAIGFILGKQGKEITQADVDFVTDLVAQQEVLTEAGTAPQPFTSQQLAYDVTGDNIIDINDQNMLEQVMTGQIPQTALAQQSQFAATGLQGQIQQQMQQQTAIQNQIAQQIATDQADKRRMQEQQQQQQLAQLMQATPVQVKTPPPAQIDYVYDPFGESIFATPQQAAMFTDPYSPITSPPTASPTGNMPITIPMQTAAGGGIIEDKTDEILRILGENK